MRILSSVLFFLGLVAASANAETCPLPEEIAPCHCYESTGDIVVLCIDEPNTLAELKTALNSLSQKNDVLLELENLKLGRIPSDFFYGIGVTSLTITDCELDSLQGEDGRASLLGLEDSLENLSILSSFTEDNVFAKLKLGHLRKLKDLYISGNTITELKDDWFDRGLVTLETLGISDNGIEKVGDRAFANLINLKQLSFEGNRFGSLKRSMLPSAAHKLNILTLEEHLTMRILSSVLFLLGLVAASVNAETCPLPEEIAPCNCDEDELTGEIVVSCMAEPNTLEDLKTVLNSLSQKDDVEIQLDSLKLGRIPSDFFYGIGVKRLDISHCELDSLQGEDGRASLLGLEDSLEELTIVSSFTEDNVPAKLKLGHLRKLKEVDISYNTITELSDDWFDRGPVTLETLYMSNNGIKKVGDRAFANLINLKQLSFDGNRFGSLKRSMLPSPAHRLDALELDNNDLVSIPEDTFSRMPSLRIVSLRTNGIARLEQRTWQPVWQQLEDIELQGNPLVCDSHMNWMFSLRVNAFISGECEAPSERKGLSLQDFIDRRGY